MPDQTSRDIDSMLDEKSELNKLGNKGMGDQTDTCYICGISPSALKALITQNRQSLVDQIKAEMGEKQKDDYTEKGLIDPVDLNIYSDGYNAMHDKVTKILEGLK